MKRDVLQSHDEPCDAKVKVTDIEFCTFVGFALNFCVKSLLSLGGGTGRLM